MPSSGFIDKKTKKNHGLSFTLNTNRLNHKYTLKLEQACWEGLIVCIKPALYLSFEIIFEISSGFIIYSLFHQGIVNAKY